MGAQPSIAWTPAQDKQREPHNFAIVEPRILSDPYRKALKVGARNLYISTTNCNAQGGPRVVSLHDWSPFYYEVGLTVSQYLEREQADSIVAVLGKVRGIMLHRICFVQSSWSGCGRHGRVLAVTDMQAFHERLLGVLAAAENAVDEDSAHQVRC